MRLPGVSIFLFQHHAERRGRSGRTHAYPPICATCDGPRSSAYQSVGRILTGKLRVLFGLGTVATEAGYQVGSTLASGSVNSS